MSVVFGIFIFLILFLFCLCMVQLPLEERELQDEEFTEWAREYNREKSKAESFLD